MSIGLPNSKRDKRARYWMLWRQGSMSAMQAITAYIQYCKRLPDRQYVFNNITTRNMLILVVSAYLALC